LHNADDDSDEIRRRIAACCRLHNVPMTELEGWLFVTGKDNFTIRVASGNGQLIVDHATIGSITKTIIENRIDVFIADPLVTLHSVPENDNMRMSEVIHIFGDIAAKCDCAIDVWPSNGTEEKEFNSDDSRGASAVGAAVRASRVFNRMSKSEAGGAGLSEDDRLFYIRIDRGKANYLPPSDESDLVPTPERRAAKRRTGRRHRAMGIPWPGRGAVARKDRGRPRRRACVP